MSVTGTYFIRLNMINPTLDRIHEWNHANMFDALDEDTEAYAIGLVKHMTDIDIDAMHFSYRDILHSIAKETYIQVSNKSLMLCNFDTWATLLMLAIDKIATEEGNKDIAKKALSGVSRMIHKYPERLDQNICIWLQDMFKNVYLF
jgi:hypothetical protein